MTPDLNEELDRLYDLICHNYHKEFEYDTYVERWRLQLNEKILLFKKYADGYLFRFLEATKPSLVVENIDIRCYYQASFKKTSPDKIYVLVKDSRGREIAGYTKYFKNYNSFSIYFYIETISII